MIFEVVIARGTRLWIDGKKPNVPGSWVCGPLDNDKGQLTRTEHPGGGELLPFDDFNLDQFEFDLGIHDYCVGDKEPTTVTLTTDKELFVLHVTTTKVVDPDVEYDDEDAMIAANTVKLANGEDLELDETMLYIRAEG